MKLPVLPADEQIELVRRWQQDGDAAARERLLAHSDGLVWNVTRRYIHCGLDWNDLIAEARAALVRAVEYFDLGRVGEVAFSTYAYQSIQNSVKWAIKCERRHLNLVRLDAPMRATGGEAEDDGGDDLTLLARLEVEATADEDTGRGEVVRIMRGMAKRIAKHNPRFRAIIRRRLLALQPETLQAIGTDCGVSRERARQLEARIIRVMRVRLARRGAQQAL